MLEGTLRGNITVNAMALKGSMHTNKFSLKGDIEIGIASDIEVYKGPFTITPNPLHSVNIATKNKFLEKNITVKKIPYFEASNLYGDTVYIGDEL